MFHLDIRFFFFLLGPLVFSVVVVLSGLDIDEGLRSTSLVLPTIS
jgi:hypothetical protein